MDLEYLLFLQDLRNATGGVFDELFNAISKFAVEILIYLPIIIFWGVDKAWGYKFLIADYLGDVVNGVIKLTVCAYRPWIRSDLIEPAGDSKVAATGYSFPSGHTVAATTIYGSAFVWQKDKRKWLAWTCAILILLTGFSRNFLGVHTPQDVAVGFLESVLILFLIGKISQKLVGNEKLTDALTYLGIVLTVIALIYISVKPYPIDYDASGAILVNPQDMMNDSFRASGTFLGLLIGSLIERHYINYKIPFGSKNLPLLVSGGVFLAFAWARLFAPATIIAALGKHWGNLIAYFIMSIFITCIWPMVITKCQASDNIG